MTGPGRISAAEANNMTLPDMPAFRVLAVNDAIENSGLPQRRRAAPFRPPTKALGILPVRARNYGREGEEGQRYV